MTKCELCQAKKITFWLHEDDICWMARCKTHPDKWVIVLKRHTKIPTARELGHILKVAEFKAPKVLWRLPSSILDHFHVHEV